MSRLGVGCLVFCLLGACSYTGPDVEPPQLTKERTAKIDNVPDPEETVRGKDEPPIVTLELGGTLHAKRLRPSEELPAGVKVGSTNLNNVPVGPALQAVLADTDITLLWGSPELQDRTVTLMNLKGPLPVVVSRICHAAKLLCAYRNGTLELMDEDTFVVSLPAAPGPVSTTAGASSSDANNTIADTIQTLVGGKVKIDKSGGTLLYTADADGQERVLSYLEELRNGRPLIVLQLYIWEVNLDDAQQLGINWSQFNPARIGGPLQNVAFNSTSGLLAGNAVPPNITTGTGVSLGAVFSGIVDANTVVKFLSTQGKVQSISSPQLTFISGTSAKFENGGTQKYVSQVGQLVTGTVAGGTQPTAGVGQNTVSTEDLKTGISITANGTYENGVVFASLEIKTSDLVKITTADTGGGVQLQLPQTNDRTVNTVLRIRPGDNLVLAGLQTSKDTRSRDGLPIGGTGGTLPLSASNVVSNSETVILVRPSVVFFSDKEHELPPVRTVKTVETVEKVVHATEVPLAPPMEMALPAPRSAIQDEFAAAVRRYQSSPVTPTASALPENIRPDGGVRTP